MPWIDRQYLDRLEALLTQFPVVCVLGPRQCGKTSFVRHRLPDWTYFDLELPSHATPLEADPEALLRQFGRHVIFDEAQQIPSLFPILRSVIDADRQQRGRFVLLGSASPHLTQAISESLAGRVGFIHMAPLHVSECHDEANVWLRGGYPDAFLAQNLSQCFSWHEAYTRTFIERDLRLFGIDVQPALMRKLWGMLAHVHGHIINASELGNALDVTYHTVNRYLDILEQTYLVRRLPPYHANVRKRLAKRPKLYLRDSGLVHYFLNITSAEDLVLSPKRGASWEGFALEQLIHWAQLQHPQTECYFWQTARKQEADLLLKRGSEIFPIEMKVHSSPQRADVKGLLHCMRDLALDHGFVVHPSGSRYSLGNGIEVLSISDMCAKLQ